MDAAPRPPFDRLQPVSDEYATLPVRAAFTWDACAEAALAGQWYLVAFRSVQRADADDALLQRMDDAAHAEATRSPGFVHYFKGPANVRRECLSFCLWNSRREAREAAGGKAHAGAISIAGSTYERYTLEFLRVTKRAGDTTFRFEPWDRRVRGQAGRMRWAPQGGPLSKPTGP